MLTDTHCHLDAPEFAGNLPQILKEARQAGVCQIVIPSVAPAGWPGIAAIARDNADVFPAFGIHPMHADLCTDEALARLDSLSRQAVAVGEIGLDYQIPSPSREEQQSAFRRQLHIALRHRLPVLLHCRRAFQDLLQILADECGNGVRGVMHAFSGSPEVANICIQRGLYISVSGSATWQKAAKPIQVIRAIPLENLLLETDAPDLTPEPYRPQTNRPAFLVEIARKVAEIKELSLEEVMKVTTSNADRLFQLSSPGLPGRCDSAPNNR